MYITINVTQMRTFSNDLYQLKKKDYLDLFMKLLNSNHLKSSK